jgi:hypothetical protein
MAVFASEFINWSALWKIVLAAFVGGVGVVVVFGFLLYGVKIANSAKSGGPRVGGLRARRRVRADLRRRDRGRDLRDGREAVLEGAGQEDRGGAYCAVRQSGLVASPS